MTVFENAVDATFAAFGELQHAHLRGIHDNLSKNSKDRAERCRNLVR
jgi:hypothetical protein